MTVNAVAFYALATLIVAGALASVCLPSLRHAVAALGGCVAAVALLEAISGALMLALLQTLALGLAAAVAALMLRRHGYGMLLGSANCWSRRWILSAVLAGGLAVLLTWTFGANSGRWFHGTGPAALLSVFRHREPLIAGLVLVLIVTAVGGSLLIGAVGRDERDFERRREERRHRDERTRRRREDRVAARTRRGSAGEAPGR